MPIRTRTSDFCGQILSRSARWIASAASSACGVVLEVDLVEPGEGVSHVRDVVDRQPAAPLRVDVGERAVGEARASGGTERWHGSGLLGEKNDRALVSLCGEAPFHFQRDPPTLRSAAK